MLRSKGKEIRAEEVSRIARPVFLFPCVILCKEGDSLPAKGEMPLKQF